MLSSNTVEKSFSESLVEEVNQIVEEAKKFEAGNKVAGRKAKNFLRNLKITAQGFIEDITIKEAAIKEAQQAPATAPTPAPTMTASKPNPELSKDIAKTNGKAVSEVKV